MKKLFTLGTLIFVFVFTSCSNEEIEHEVTQEANNKLLINQIANVAFNNGRPQRPQPPIFADCIVYSGLVTPAEFNPANGNFDELYVMPEAMFADGIPLISDSKPGDQDYNGGRWHLNVLKAGIDPAIYANACAEEDLDPNDFDATEMYFACPLLPRRN